MGDRDTEPGEHDTDRLRAIREPRAEGDHQERDEEEKGNLLAGDRLHPARKGERSDNEQYDRCEGGSGWSDASGERIDANDGQCREDREDKPKDFSKIECTDDPDQGGEPGQRKHRRVGIVIGWNNPASPSDRFETDGELLLNIPAEEECAARGDSIGGCEHTEEEQRCDRRPPTGEGETECTE